LRPTNDPYVTPVPDPRLARIGTAQLPEDVNATTESIPIDSPEFFSESISSALQASVIDDEIVQCADITRAPPWRLLNCARGAFGTTAAGHARGAEIGKLDDHPYKVFLSTSDLSIEMGRTIAGLFNAAGLRQLSFDGLEGNRSTGMGNYGEILFTTSWYNALDPSIRQHYVADASRTSHYFWHIYSRMNWGEPWYAGFRESQTEYRLKNQAYFKRNLMPGMLGWFSMRPETSVEDIEWMLARSAGFDAGYGFVTELDRVKANGQSDEILQLLGRWERARMSGAFTASQKEAMQDISNEFHLEALDSTSWRLYPIRSLKETYRSGDRQPGEPAAATYSITVRPDEGEVGFILSAEGTEARGVTVELDGKSLFPRPVNLPAGHHLKYTGGDSATHYAATWNNLGAVPIQTGLLHVAPGRHEVRILAETGGAPDASLKLEIRLTGAPETIRIN